VIDDGFTAGSVYQDVILSEYERETLAMLAAEIDDPWLASQLAGIVPAPPRRKFHIPTCWVAIVLLMLGAAVTLAGFTRWLWAAGLGVALMVAGGALLVAPQLMRITRARRPKVRPPAERGQWAPPRTSRRPPA
jgi:CBS-domain-containing membrane protein